MKKILNLIASTALVFSMATAVASAQENSCEISNTGPGSVNSCEINEENFVSITCENGLIVTNDTSQQAESSQVVVVDNTTAYNGESGDASNINTVINELAASCGEVAQTPTENPRNPVNPTQAENEESESEEDAPQVASAPQGGVSAGGGGATGLDVAAVAGIIASIGALASGAFLYRKFEL